MDLADYRRITERGVMKTSKRWVAILVAGGGEVTIGGKNAHGE